MAAALREAGRRAAARAAVDAQERGDSRAAAACRAKPLIEIARAAKKDDALAGLERWKARHPDAAAHLQPADVLVDSMRGRSSTWTRVRVNLEHVPEDLRPDAGAARSRLRSVGRRSATRPTARESGGPPPVGARLTRGHPHHGATAAPCRPLAPVVPKISASSPAA